MKQLSLLIVILATLPHFFAQTVSTQFGQVVGATSGTIKQFLGIPFAKPPVGNLRWKAPQNPDSWGSPLTTTAFAPECPQKKFAVDGTSEITGDEDCLYLNIWTPQTSSSANLPVMVFIHGGGNQQGSASVESGNTPMYHGKNLAERGDVVVVTIQYRLGPLGFLAHPGLEPETSNNTSGNYAAMDQILALNWVQNNISNFGGNPGNVTIFGESAGAVNVGNLLCSPLANGLFYRAIMQSGVPVIATYPIVKNMGISYVDSFTTVGTDVDKIAFMRTVPADSLVKFQEQPLSGGVVGLNWASNVDNIVFNQLANDAFQSGNFNHVPVIIGSNEDEMSMSVPPTVTPGMMTLLISSTIPTGLQAQAMTLYPPGSSNAVAKDSYIRFLTDKQFTATSRRIAECISKNQNEHVYRYFFTQSHSLALLAPYGAYHGMELFYVFNTWENTTGGQGSLFSDGDDSTQVACLNYWTQFAKTGDPNGNGMVNWGYYESNGDCYLNLKATPVSGNCGLRTPESNFWDDVINYQPCTSSVGLEDEELADIEFTIFPNPSTGIYQLDFKTDKDFKVIIKDLQGKQVKELQKPAYIDLSNYSTGTYLISILIENKVVLTRKLVKID